jgi:predicted transcriptional regulator
MNAKRDRLEIIQDILSVIQQKSGGIKKTHILYKANLSHEMLNQYLEELALKQFILEQKDKKDKITYALTDKGHNFLQQYRVIKGFTESYGITN